MELPILPSLIVSNVWVLETAGRVGFECRGEWVALRNLLFYSIIGSLTILCLLFHFIDWAVVAGDYVFPGVTNQGGTNVSATVNGDTGDNNFDIYNTKTVADLFDAVGLTYKTYSETYPASGTCFLGSSYGNETDEDVANFNFGTKGSNPANRLYKRKHNPLLSFTSFTNSRKRCATQKDFNDLSKDLETGNLPAFSFVVPNQAHDGHDTTISCSGKWFTQFLKNITSSKDNK